MPSKTHSTLSRRARPAFWDGRHQQNIVRKTPLARTCFFEASPNLGASALRWTWEVNLEPLWSLDVGVWSFRSVFHRSPCGGRPTFGSVVSAFRAFLCLFVALLSAFSLNFF